MTESNVTLGYLGALNTWDKRFNFSNNPDRSISGRFLDFLLKKKFFAQPWECLG
jgi:hypothetical protein